MSNFKIVIDSTESISNAVTTDTSVVIDTNKLSTLSIQPVWDVNTPSAGVFTAAVTDICTDVGHGFTTGLKGQCTTTTTLPAGLSLATDYFVIVLDDDTYKLAASLADALAGTAVDITDTGTGVHTFTPTSIAGGVIHLEESNDKVNWVDISGATANITADGSTLFKVTSLPCQWVRVHLTLTAGRVSVDNYVVGKE